MDEHASEISAELLHEVVGERRDDLPCYECGEYRDTLIVKVRDTTRDVCHTCATRLGIEW